ncbi:DUF6630 family protein [Actinokineospora sp. G85]|uniref:DUF6630 family protein n=1 Tax=Actinokineospora sp. G85 TaxID=3406626 RepID=UPI003C7597E9
MSTSPRDALLAVAALLAPTKPDVAARAAAAVDDPAGFVAAHADSLDDRGIDAPFPGLPWIALVDALAEHGLLAEVDWKEDPTEVLGLLARLSSHPIPRDWAEGVDMAVPTHEFLAAAGDQVREHTTKALAVLDIESDCHPLVFVPADRAADLTRLAAEAGFAAHVLSRR